MAICRIVDTGATAEQYDQIRQSLGIDQSPPPGGRIHVAAKGDDGKIRVIEVWDSREQAEQWSQRVLAQRAEHGVAGDPQITYYDVHNVITA
jgi:heme-degrading monooxygenase HmoA